MDPTQLQPGHRLDRYELLCPLAYGGMAAVWLARFGGRRGFERLVVVKMILPQYAGDPRFQEMFVDEARIASRIEHANVARILDVGGEDENTTYIVMEWVDGDSLSKVIRAAEGKKQPIPAGIALRIGADAALGLHAAHVLEQRDGTPLGVVHRDVSPQNILISNAGTTVLIDFGVAKARDRVSEDTSVGQLKGKIRYMAPEQALGKNIDLRADIWSLGAILYELFAGESPYDAPNEVTTLHKLTSGVAPAMLPAHVPGPIREVVARALAYEAEGRFASALELSEALESAMAAIGEPTSTAMVASYTARLLADRKSARKRAVDTALAAAHARDAERAPLASMRPGPPGSSFAPPARGAEEHTARLHAPPVPSFDRTSTPSAGSLSGRSPSSRPMGYAEAPSGASSSTLGSTAMEYPPAIAEDPALRKRRMVTASVLGVSMAAGLVGLVLIFSTAIMRHEARRASATNAPPQAAEPPSADRADRAETRPDGGAAALVGTNAAVPTPVLTNAPSTTKPARGL